MHAYDRATEDDMGRTCSTYEKMNACGILVGELEAKTQLERPKLRWEDILKCILVTQDEMLHTVFIWLRIGPQLMALVHTV
jgi:hypothetical protein